MRHLVLIHAGTGVMDLKADTDLAGFSFGREQVDGCVDISFICELDRIADQIE